MKVTAARGETPSDPRWALGLFVTALVLRAAHLVTIRDAPLFNHLFIDPAMYDAWGRRIARGELVAPAPFFIDPLYQYFVGSVYALFGQSQLAVSAVQVLAGAFVAPLVHAAARPWLGRAAARTAGLLAACYPIAIYYSALLLEPALAMPLVALFLWALSRALDGGGSRAWFAGGAAFALICLTRGTLLLALPLLVAWAGVDGGRSPLSGWRRAGALGLGALAVFTATLAHNLAVSGEWIPTTTNWGQIFYIGNNPGNPSGRFDELPFVRSTPQHEQEDFKAEAERRAGRPLTHRETSAFWLSEGLSWVRDEPGAWARTLLSKLRLYWGAWETPASHDYYLFRRTAPLLGLPVPAFGLLGPLALVGCALAWRRGAWPRVVVVLVAAATLTTVPFFVLTRLRALLVPALCVLAGLGVVELGRAAREAATGGARSRLVRLGAGLALAWAVVNLPVRKPADTWSFRLAERLGLPTRLETTASGRFNLGVTYAARASEAQNPGRWLALAAAELRVSLDEEERPGTWIELGKVLARQRRDDEAIAAYRRVLVLEPGDWRPHHAIGLLERRAGRFAAAAEAFQQALAREPAHAASARELGAVLLELGRPAEAAEAYRHLLRLRPGDPAASAALAALERAASR